MQARLFWILRHSSFKASDLRLSKLGRESDVLLRNLFEHYIHDMAEWFDIDTEADGSYSYDTSLIWEKGYDAYVARVGESIAGFALIGCDAGAYDVHEFFVIRRFRRSGLGQRMATMLWDEHPGAWLVRVLEANTPAVRFWRTAISQYSGGSYEEEGRDVNGRMWRFLRFQSLSAANRPLHDSHSPAAPPASE
jgi:predicted acetyltransferase